jgi:hypothetical protein
MTEGPPLELSGGPSSLAGYQDTKIVKSGTLDR